MSTFQKTTISDAKKRALEALERRFAATKADLVQKQQKNKKQAFEGEEKSPKKLSSTSYSREHEPKASDTTPPVSSSKKGHFTFSSHGTSDEEASGPAYFHLSQPMHENLLGDSNKPSSGRSGLADKIIHDLLQSGDSAHKYMQGSKSMKIDNWLLLDSFSQGRSVLTKARARAVQNHSKRSKRHMSMQQHRKCGSFDLPQDFHDFDLFKPMHEMWKDYIIQLLKDTGKGQLDQRLLTADLHGAFLLVVECKVTAFTGTSGIMIRETAETFGIITLDNKFRVIPKKRSIFIFQAGCWKVTLQGDKLSSRNTCS